MSETAPGVRVERICRRYPQPGIGLAANSQQFDAGPATFAAIGNDGRQKKRKLHAIPGKVHPITCEKNDTSGEIRQETGWRLRDVINFRWQRLNAETPKEVTAKRAR